MDPRELITQLLMRRQEALVQEQAMAAMKPHLTMKLNRNPGPMDAKVIPRVVQPNNLDELFHDIKLRGWHGLDTL